jgi:uroporphyrinogen decarboxylase
MPQRTIGPTLAFDKRRQRFAADGKRAALLDSRCVCRFLITKGRLKLNKRDMMLGLGKSALPAGYVPAAFFLHFDAAHHRGQAAVDRHLEYFRHTGMDFVKIQYENPFPAHPEIQKPRDWARMPVHGVDFHAAPLDVIEGIAKAAKKDAVVVVTLYSALMMAHQATSRDIVTRHLEEDPESTAKGLDAINESLLLFVREAVRRGVDGFYASTQGGEAGRFTDPSVFSRYIKPRDLALMKEIDRIGAFNILHVCDYHGIYGDLTPYLDYPGRVVNCGTRLQSGAITPRQIADLFKRPFMGGMDRHGIIVNGSAEEIRREVRRVISEAPPRFLLGADCTVPSDISWDNIKAAIDTAHGA